jgi:hypothetical protein
MTGLLAAQLESRNESGEQDNQRTGCHATGEGP